jgi:hypothetical protein
MVRWTIAVVLFSCMATPKLAQATKQPDSARQAHVSEPRPIELSEAGQTAAAPSATTYPLDSFRDFSAVMIGSRAEPGEGTSQGHIYRFGNRMRMEEPGGLGYFITDLNTGESYGILVRSQLHPRRSSLYPCHPISHRRQGGCHGDARFCGERDRGQPLQPG